MKNRINEFQSDNYQVGFVPTMGYFHQGHTSLMERSIGDNLITVVSIFVNPIQFGPGEDYQIYPRDLSGDQQVAEQLGVDVLFVPNAEDMYPEDFGTQVHVSGITDALCGASRPGHFAGVTTVVSKLFNIVQPDRAYFGRKDYQQLLVIQQMVTDLNKNIDIIGCPIAREKDGLAVSSRNVNLTESQRRSAPVLYHSLQEAKSKIMKGDKNPQALKEMIENKIAAEPETEIDYVEIVDGDNLSKLTQIQGNVLIALAVHLGDTRLIDNVLIQLDEY